MLEQLDTSGVHVYDLRIGKDLRQEALPIKEKGEIQLR